MPAESVEVCAGNDRGGKLTIAGHVSLWMGARADRIGVGLGNCVVSGRNGARVRLIRSVWCRLLVHLLHVHHRVPVTLLIPLEETQKTLVCHKAIQVTKFA